MSFCIKTISADAVVIAVPNGTTCASVGATDIVLGTEPLTLDQSIDLSMLVLAMWTTAWVFKQILRQIRNL